MIQFVFSDSIENTETRDEENQLQSLYDSEAC